MKVDYTKRNTTSFSNSYITQFFYYIVDFDLFRKISLIVLIKIAKFPYNLKLQYIIWPQY